MIVSISKNGIQNRPCSIHRSPKGITIDRMHNIEICEESIFGNSLIMVRTFFQKQTSLIYLKGSITEGEGEMETKREDIHPVVTVGPGQAEAIYQKPCRGQAPTC